MSTEAWHRRHAVQIVAALPDDVEDALTVLSLARVLVMGFLAGQAGLGSQPLDEALERDLGNVVSLSSATSGSNR